MSCTNCSLIFDDMTPRTKCVGCEKLLCISCVINEVDICKDCYSFNNINDLRSSVSKANLNIGVEQISVSKANLNKSKPKKTPKISKNYQVPTSPATTTNLIQQLEGIYNMIRNGIDVYHRFDNKVLVIIGRFNIDIIKTKKGYQAKYYDQTFYWGPTSGYMNNRFPVEKLSNIYNYINHVDTFYEICKNKQIEALRQSIPNSILVRMDKNLFTLIRNFL